MDNLLVLFHVELYRNWHNLTEKREKWFHLEFGFMTIKIIYYSFVKIAYTSSKWAEYCNVIMVLDNAGRILVTVAYC